MGRRRSTRLDLDDPWNVRLREIVRTAAELFEKSGYANATMEDIANAVGLAKPTLYHYVNSKDDILYLIHREFMTVAFEALKKRVDTDGDTETILHGVIVDLVELVCSRRAQVRVFFEHFRDLPASKARLVVEERRNYTATVERIVRRGVRRGDMVRGVDPLLATLAVFGACNWAYQWYNPRGRLSSSQIGETFAAILLRGLVVR